MYLFGILYPQGGGTMSTDTQSAKIERRSLPETRPFNMRMTHILMDRLQAYADKSGRDMSEIIRGAIDDYLTSKGF